MANDAHRLQAHVSAVIADIYSYVVSRVLQPGAAGQGQPWDGYNFISSRLNTNLENANFGTSSVVMTPTVISSSTFVNGTDAQATETFADTKATTASATVSVTNGISTGVNTTFSLGFLIAGTTVGFSVSTNFSSTDSQTSTVTQTWAWSSQIPVPPHSTVTASVVVQTGNYSVPFTAKIRLSGDFYWTRIVGNNTYNVGGNLSWIFGTWPLAGVTVIDDNTADCDVAGTWDAIEGSNYQVIIQQTDTRGNVVSTETLPSVKQITLYKGSKE